MHHPIYTKVCPECGSDFIGLSQNHANSQYVVEIRKSVMRIVSVIKCYNCMWRGEEIWYSTFEKVVW